ncbi:MAG: hypothetical protein M0P13_12495 [Fibrobacteraceae bacterium]|nr:hypothetical protein [Fibrobacteraceae bacterium]
MKSPVTDSSGQTIIYYALVHSNHTARGQTLGAERDKTKAVPPTDGAVAQC